MLDELNLPTIPGAPAGRRSAVLDQAHVGDILGALGTVRQHDTAPRLSWRTRLLTLLAIMGPGLVVMIGDNDAGGVATYAQAGQNYGTSLLWTLFLLIPVLIVNQEMVVRLGLVTGVGHARLILERFGKFWGAFSVGDLFILNFLTIITEFIGLSLGMQYFGISPYVSVPLSALALIAVTVTGSFRRWERFMYVLIVVNLIVIPLAILGHPSWGQVAHDWFVPTIQGGVNSTVLLLIIGIVGTTVAPWQLFFQQSNVVDKRLSPPWYKYEFADTIIGSVFTQIGAAGLMIVCAFAFTGTKLFGQFTDAGGVATGLAATIGPIAGDLFAIFLLDAALIGAAAVSLATSYAFGDVFSIKHSLHRNVRDGRGFYAIYSALVIAAAAIVLIPNAPLGLMTLAVQVLAGVLLPSATVFLLLLCNDKAVLGPWVNRPWLNIVASVIVGVLVVLSLILAVTTLFPDVDAIPLTEGLFGALAVAMVAIAVLQSVRGRRGARADERELAGVESRTWRMPPLAELAKPQSSLMREVGLFTLRGYLLIAAILAVVKFVQLALGGGAAS
jgi:NRAMP (natural resistance-associated macrophage protein)-like metal ion transporter